MANFLETQPASFSKLAPFPTELYGRVGVMKQAMYDANTAKVQAYYDSIAGMDLAKEPQKAYLNEKLTQLQSDLGQLSGADFSKQSVVNQAAGMAGPISKDPVLLQAVLSTAKFRKGVEEQEKARKDGKNYYTNDWKFNSEAEKWLTDGKVDSSFNTDYFQHQDVIKKGIEAFKAKGLDVSEKDFATNPDGTFNDIMIRQKNKGLKPQDIKDILEVVYDANDYRQLAIDGEFAHKDDNPDELKKKIEKFTQPEVMKLLGKKKEMELDLSGASGEDHTRIKQNIADMDEYITSILENNQKLYKKIDEGDIQGAGAAYHTASHINRFASAFAFTEYSEQILSNPGKEMEMRKLEYALKLREVQAKEKEGESILGTLTMGAPNINLTSAKVEDALETERKAIETNKAMVISNYSGTSTPEEGAQWYTHQKALYDMNDPKVTPEMRQHFDEISIQQKNYNTHAANTKKVFDEVAQRYPMTVKLPAELQNVRLVGKDGEVVDYKAEEVLDLQMRLKDALGQKYKSWKEFGNFLLSQAAYAVDPVNGALSDWDLTHMSYFYAKLNERERFLFENSHIGKGVFGFHRYTDQENKTLDIVGEGQDAYENVAVKREKERVKLIKERTGLGTVGFQPIATDPKDQVKMRALLSNYVSELERNDMGISTGTLSNDTDIDDVKEIMAGSNVTTTLMSAPGNGYMEDQYAITVSGEVDKVVKTANITISDTQRRELLGKTKDPTSAESFAMETQRVIMSGGKKTTNPAGPTAAPEVAVGTAYLQKLHFPGVQKFSIRGDIIEGSSSTSVAAKLYIFNPRNKKWTPTYLDQGKMRDYGSLSWGIQHLTDEQVFKMLFPDETPTREAMELIKKQSSFR